MALTQGGRANQAGRILETNVESILIGHSYFQVGNHVSQEFLLTANLLKKRYAKQVNIGSGIYQTSLKVDFYVVGSPVMPSGLIIECKWQESGGSVDEKFPYLNLNIQNSYPAPTIVVIGGEGMREGAIQWLRRQVTSNNNLLAVQTLDRFIAWTNKNF
ncbi:PD-(D/E)XK nuclease superfamily protein [Nodularia sp. UHCC 0506]|uniref:PD-(D/E)XK nuclease superfamily protein n=1 Tax=Nodularia sp. UHCC 0506 TaxID=3110243 RepID=UPI002B1F39D9|nr:PD-(D/E)XK nuclease superfamily protein [Nodularia sp. UHCC 0506]MEA5514889.1 PD-(D/E)XK nuclease superfamily protein [Nodularia sp. UHCC 0506]